MTISHLSTRELAERWNISRRTLDRWRWAGEGPRFLKLGGRVVYPPHGYEPADLACIKHRLAAWSRWAERHPAIGLLR